PIRGTLRVSIPPMGDPSFHRLICDFALAYPDVRIQVNASTRPVDLLKEGYDLALRAGTITEPGREAKRTWTMARPVKPSTSAPESSSSGVIHDNRSQRRSRGRGGAANPRARVHRTISLLANS